ncbi:sugar ABC transporter permease [Inquilinus limosus]|uniref:carbohydrate ABC transporter permease n=1 Tax=Inquilinus limosus TaxID=171674 RepID=UPI003F1923C7
MSAPLAARLPGMTPVLLILPSFLLAAFIITYPVWDLLTVASHQVNRFGQLRGFTGLANLENVLADPLFIDSLWRTLVWTAGVVAGTVAVSVPVALILNTEFYGRGIARVIVMLPWSVSLTMMAIVWRWALNGESGLLNLTLQDLGLIDQKVVWLASAVTAFPVQILIGILVSIPFTVTIFLGGLSSIPNDIYEAAATDGASPWQQFRTLTLPLMRPFINMAVVLNIIYVFNSFPIIWVLTEGGPSDSTQILVTYLYKLAFKLGKMGEAASISLVMFAILLAFTLIYLRMAMKGERNA